MTFAAGGVFANWGPPKPSTKRRKGQWTGSPIRLQRNQLGAQSHPASDWESWWITNQHGSYSNYLVFVWVRTQNSQEYDQMYCTCTILL